MIMIIMNNDNDNDNKCVLLPRSTYKYNMTDIYVMNIIFWNE